MAYDNGRTLHAPATFSQRRRYSALGLAADGQLLQLLRERPGVRFRCGGRNGVALGGRSVLDHLHRAVDLVESLGYEPRRRNLGKGNQAANRFVEPLGRAFGSPDGNDARIRIVQVVNNDAVELWFLAEQNEIGHVNPCAEFVAVWNAVRLGPERVS